MGDTAAAAEVVAVEDLVVAFGSFKALKGVDLTVSRGEVVGLLGENGAGKSTLIKVLSGVYQPTSGTVRLAGVPVTLDTPTKAISAGIATVHQHSMLAGNLTVAANLVLGKEPGADRARWLVTDRTIRARAQEIVEHVGIDLPLDARVEDLPLAMKQRVEIVRAAFHATSMLILDEPTAALEPSEVDELFETVRHLRSRGIAVLYISHRLDEIPQLCDRAVVLRDGRKVGELEGDQCVPDEIIPLLAGRPLEDLFPQLPAPRDAVVLDAQDVAVGRGAPITITLREGEVVGLTGAQGAGQREVARAIAGIGPRTGTVEVGGASLAADDVGAAIRAGITYVSGDRADGVFPDQSVWRNAAIGSLPALTSAGFVRGRREKSLGTRLAKVYGVRSADPDQPISTLSGGNQQKVLIARWAGTQPRVIVLDEPTLGVDVGARREIYDLAAELLSQGTALLIVSSDHAELQAMSHRVVVFADGSPVAELEAQDATEEAVLAARLSGQPSPRKDLS